MSAVFPRHTKSEFPIATSANGVYLYDAAGKAYLDGSGGAAVSCLGHGDVDVVSAVKKQMDTLAFAHTGFFSSEAAEALAEKLIEHAPAGMERVYQVSGGSEAMEASLKLARQYFLEVGQPQRQHVIARQQSYHGNTLGALATGGNQFRRIQFEPMLMNVSHIPPCYEYRHRAEGESETEYGLRAANELEKEIQRLGEDKVMAFVAETVVGATVGALPPVAGYFKRIREICDQYGILLILDEVMCGMGRTGTLFACEQEGITPDIIAVAKGLGAGYQPVGAMLCSGDVYAAIEQGSGFFQHGHTYLGHPAASAAALAVLTKLTDGGLVQRCAKRSTVFQSALSDVFGEHPHVGDIRGRGLFWGLEIVKDRQTKEPFASDAMLHAKIKKAAMQEGLICYPGGGTIDGKRGDHILFAPAFIIEHQHIDELVDKFSRALTVALKTVGH